MVIVITNRKLCFGNFLSRLEQLAQAKPGLIVLREKDLDEEEYTNLAQKVSVICSRCQVPLALHSYPEVAKSLHVSHLHLPLSLLKDRELPSGISQIGTSVHSIQDAITATALGASYLIAGHIYPTGCKPGLPARGLDFLKNICQTVSLPVYAIGGINMQRVPSVLKQGAAGLCIMSELMQCSDPFDRLSGYINLEREIQRKSFLHSL